jgi:hypothetical protein
MYRSCDLRVFRLKAMIRKKGMAAISLSEIDESMYEGLLCRIRDKPEWSEILIG